MRPWRQDFPFSPPSELQGIAPEETQGAGDEQKPRFTWKPLIQDSGDRICLGKVSGWSRCAGALRLWSKHPEGCGLSFVPFIKSHTVLHLPCLVACPRDRPPIIVASGTTACSMHGSAAVHEHWSQNSSSISFHHHHYPWSYNFLVRSVRFFKP